MAKERRSNIPRQRNHLSSIEQRGRVVKSLHNFKVAERFGNKPLVGTDPILIGLIRKALAK